jgi:hypothetical protein
MHTQTGSLDSMIDTSLTDVILALCASRHFGIREAIAAATRQKPRRLGSASADAAVSSRFQLMPNTSGTAAFWASERRKRDPGSSNLAGNGLRPLRLGSG